MAKQEGPVYLTASQISENLEKADKLFKRPREEWIEDILQGRVVLNGNCDDCYQLLLGLHKLNYNKECLTLCDYFSTPVESDGQQTEPIGRYHPGILLCGMSAARQINDLPKGDAYLDRAEQQIGIWNDAHLQEAIDYCLFRRSTTNADRGEEFVRKALRLTEKYVQLHPTVEFGYLKKAQILRDTGKLSECVSFLRATIFSPTDPNIRNELSCPQCCCLLLQQLTGQTPEEIEEQIRLAEKGISDADSGGMQDKGYFSYRIAKAKEITLEKSAKATKGLRDEIIDCYQKALKDGISDESIKGDVDKRLAQLTPSDETEAAIAALKEYFAERFEELRKILFQWVELPDRRQMAESISLIDKELKQWSSAERLMMNQALEEIRKLLTDAQSRELPKETTASSTE